ncbi:MAG: polysaccharide deacetylase family protein [Anaerolineales bacterium]
MKPSAVPLATGEAVPSGPAVASPLYLTPEPPPVFSTSILQKGVVPQTYLQSECAYLQEQWDPNRSAPGTIVVPVFFHGVSPQGDPKSNTTSLADLQAALWTAKQLGYEMITSQQLAAFLYSNARIPFRSMIWIVDDHNIGTLENQMVPIARQNGWVITSAWEIASTTPELWTRIEKLSATGLVDVEAHGYIHNIPISSASSEAYLEGEIYKPIPILEQHFGHRPVALIWPGSGFTPHAAAVARQAGYELAFTSYARGPLMFDWIPLGGWERTVGDPLMVLPREWGSSGLAGQLDKYAQLGEQAAGQASKSYPEEARYYREACGGELFPPATPQPQRTQTP